MKKLLYTTFFSLTFSISSYSQCESNLLINGSFTSVKGEGITAPGWAGTTTPDVNDTGTLNTTACYAWVGTPLASPDGGTWQNLFSSTETISQTVTLTQGRTYHLCFEYAAQGIQCGMLATYDGPVGINVYINGALAFTAPDDTTQYTWETVCFSFVATSDSVVIELAPTQYEYVGIDGSCLSQGDITFVGADNSVMKTKIYPNPIKNELTIEMNTPDEPVEFILYDYSGRVLIQQMLTKSIILKTDQLSAGFFIYNLRRNSIVLDKGIIVKL